jgi:hypothetical protein
VNKWNDFHDVVNRFVAFGEMYRIIGPVVPEAPDLEPAKLGKPLNVLYLNVIAVQHNRKRRAPTMDHGLGDAKGRAVRGAREDFRQSRLLAACARILFCARALQGLWIALWWVNVNGISRTEAAHWLFALDGVVLVSFFLLGVYVGAIERAGILPARPAILSGTAAAMPLFSPPDRIPWRFG